MPKKKVFGKIRDQVKQVPLGRVVTYGQLAESLGLKDARIVGWALRGRKDPYVPCHRVVKKDGQLALNYSLGDWRDQKRRLLLEGVSFVDETHVDLKKHQHFFK